MAKKSKALRELEAMEEAEMLVLNASKARWDTIQVLKDRLAQVAVAKSNARRTSVRLGRGTRPVETTTVDGITSTGISPHPIESTPKCIYPFARTTHYGGDKEERGWEAFLWL